jgi:hypothetical protein
MRAGTLMRRGGRVLPAAAFRLFSVSVQTDHPQGLAAGLLAKLWMRLSKP